MAKAEQLKESLQESLQQVIHLLNKHKLVEDLVHKQDMPRHALVESLVHKQNLTELQKKLESLHSLSFSVWQQFSLSKQNA